MTKVRETTGNNRAVKVTARLLLAVLIGLALLGSLPAPVQAQDEYDPEIINLELGGDGATPWSIEDIMPCETGTKTVTLHNAGSADGVVIIWISDIDSGEGDDPEPETDTSPANGGELDDNLMLGLTASSGLSPNPRPPTEIINFSQSAAASNIIIDPLNSGDTITLTWKWELPCSTGNEAQGDTLQFTINYLLEEILSPPPLPPEPTPEPPPVYSGSPIEEPSPGTIAEVPQFCNCPADVSASTDACLCTAASDVALGNLPVCYQQDVVAVTNDAPLIFPLGDTIVTWTMTDITGNRQTCTQTVTVTEGDHYFEIDMLGKISKVRVECPDHIVTETHVVSDPDDMHFLTIERGTYIICQDSDRCTPYPEVIAMSLSEETLPEPDGLARVSPVYEFKGYMDKDLLDPVCSHVDFDRPVMLQVSYDPDKLPLSASAPFLAYYDTERGKWVKLESATGMVAELMVNGLTQRFSLFAVMVEVPTEVSGVDWWFIVAIVGGSILLFWLIWSYVYRRRRHQRSTTGN